MIREMVEALTVTGTAMINPMPRPPITSLLPAIVAMILFFGVIIFIIVSVFTKAKDLECVNYHVEQYVLEGRDLETAQYLVERLGICK